MDFLELSKKRYSCRKLSNKKVSNDLIDKIIEAGILAPTAVNKQPFKIFKMESEKAKDAIAQSTKFTFGADCFLVVGYKEDEAWIRSFDDKNFAAVDASIVATHMMMEITDLGLATTWVGYFDAPLLKKLCKELEGYELIAIFPIGYESEDAEPSERHFIRKNKNEIIATL